MIPAVASLFLFLALATGAIAVASNRQGGSALDRRVRRLRSPSPGERPDAAEPTLERAHSSIPAFRRLLSGSEWADATALDLQRANVQLRVGEYLLIRALVAVTLGVIIVLASRMHPVGLVVGLLVGAASYLVAPLLLSFLRQRRQQQIENQMVELAPMLASSLRSGFALQQGMELAAKQIASPLGDELHLLLSDVNLGASMESALLDMGRRIGSTDLDMLITAVLVQRMSGGNLAEILDQSAQTLRERERLRGDVRTLTAQQRLSGYVLAVYPVLVGLGLLAIAPATYSLLFTETMGRVLLGVAFGLQTIGFLVIQRLIKIEI